MKFLVITHTIHKRKDDLFFAYEPYVREMNIWFKFVDNVKVVGHFTTDIPNSIDSYYIHKKLSIFNIPQISFISFFKILKSLYKIPIILFYVFKGMMWADHIHLRCPGNIGLLGCLVQIFFPKKPKTAKYAGNWDPKSKQPLSYKLQKWILSNTFLTRNCKVLVYGKWQNQTKNIIPFFTASYKKNEIEVIPNKDLTKQINLIYVGTFSEGKQPLLSVKITQELVEKGYNVNLNMFGSGQQFEIVQNYIKDKFLEKNIILHGSQSKTLIKDYYKKSHFLLFISKSEGWPKVVAEAMFWQCLPISSNVSCIPYMLNNNKRGDLVINGMKISDISAIIINYINNKDLYFKKVKAAKQWSQKITLDKFESEIKKILF